MSYSRRQLYAMGETLGDCVTRKEGGRIVYGGGGSGGGGGAPTQSTTNTSNIPEYARPYVETMLGATQQQLFNTAPGPDGTTQITSVKPYQAFGSASGEVDASGNPMLRGLGPGEMTAARSAYAPFDPLQNQAYQGAANLQVPGQYGQATDVAGAGIMGVLGTAGQAGQYGGLGAQYGGMGAQAGQRAGMYGGMGAQAGRQGMGYGGMGAQAGLQGMQYGAEAGQAGAQYAQQATDPYATQAYMSPYMQNVVGVQQREAQRASDILGAQQRGQATQAGAFGGGRQAIMEAERQRNLATQMGGIQATGLQSAFDQARQAQQFGANLGLQGKQAAMQGAGLGIQGAQAGMQGAGLGIQGAQTGIQGQQAGIQGAQAGMQGAQIGLQGVGAQQAGYGQAIQGAGQLGNLGTQQLAAQQGILGTQAQYGASRQAYDQNVLNQAIQNYAMQTQYPQQQLAFMNAQLRGLPMQASTTQSYQAPPSYLSQAAGLGVTGLALNKLGAFGKKGGLPKDFEKKRMDDGIAGLGLYNAMKS